MGQPADIAPSAYQYRADRKAEENAPESWLALMRYANQPLNKPVDRSAPAIKQALCGLLWEEIRPVQRLELTWTGSAQRRPAPEDVVITTLDNRGTASSWWNNLAAAKRAIKPTVSTDDKTGTTYVYNLDTPTCGVVISVSGGKTAADCDVPAVRCLVADTWKKMDLEIEWGFDRATADKDYSGRIETYDGVVAGLRPLEGDESTTAVDSGSWRSLGKGSARRGVKLSLLYMGTSKWRKVQPFTSQRDDVARTIVTLWTKAGNFSFLAADLDNGPILAPEYGFFVRRTGRPAPTVSPPPLEPRTPLNAPDGENGQHCRQHEPAGLGKQRHAMVRRQPNGRGGFRLGHHHPGAKRGHAPGKSGGGGRRLAESRQGDRGGHGARRSTPSTAATGSSGGSCTWPTRGGRRWRTAQRTDGAGGRCPRPRRRRTSTPSRSSPAT